MNNTALALGLAACVFSAQAAEQTPKFYVGIKSGGSSIHHGVSAFKQIGNEVNSTSLAYGAFMGYHLTPYFATELGYDRFGQVDVEQTNSNSPFSFKHRVQGAQFSLKAHYPMTQHLSLFGRLGTAYVQNRYTLSEGQIHEKFRKNAFSPLLGTGLDYQLLPELRFRVEYQWLGKVGKSRTLDHLNRRYNPDVHTLTVGLAYYFGQTPRSTQDDSSVQQVSKNFEFDADVLFDFNKSHLKADAMARLDQAYVDISALSLSKTNIYINGYSDRLGTEEFNLSLSQQRAKNVANYMISKGLDAASITAIGHGRAYPVTGNTCDSVTERQALIHCLAPDRRVSLQVKGLK